jgi:hypothetical protein
MNSTPRNCSSMKTWRIVDPGLVNFIRSSRTLHRCARSAGQIGRPKSSWMYITAPSCNTSIVRGPRPDSMENSASIHRCRCAARWAGHDRLFSDERRFIGCRKHANPDRATSGHPFRAIGAACARCPVRGGRRRVRLPMVPKVAVAARHAGGSSPQASHCFGRRFSRAHSERLIDALIWNTDGAH